MPSRTRERLNLPQRRPRLRSPSPALVVASVALFVALSGLAYAATLPRNSVGAAQIRSNAVGASEIRSRAVGSSELRDRSIRLGDISTNARGSLRGAQGPAGPVGPVGPAHPAFHAAISSSGGAARGNATAASNVGAGIFRVSFAQDVSRCEAVATLAYVDANGPAPEPSPGRITVRPSGTGVEVRTYDTDGAARDLPFNVIVAC